MELLLDTATRRVLAYGDSLVAGTGQVVETLVPAELVNFQAAIGKVQGDGYVTVSADHQTIAVVPPSAAWTAAQTALAAAVALKSEHKTALSNLYAALTANSTLTGNDLTALTTIANALAAGTQPTAAQQLIIDRVYLRLLVILLS